MSTTATGRVASQVIDDDIQAFQALATMTGYDPRDANASIEAVTATFNGNPVTALPARRPRSGPIGRRCRRCSRRDRIPAPRRWASRANGSARARRWSTGSKAT